jgi:hypothetical protein
MNYIEGEDDVEKRRGRDFFGFRTYKFIAKTIFRYALRNKKRKILEREGEGE